MCYSLSGTNSFVSQDQASWLRKEEGAADVDDGVYPMDFYSNDSLGPWTPNFKPPTDVKIPGSCANKGTEGCACKNKMTS